MRTSAINDARADVARRLSAPQVGDNAAQFRVAFKQLVDAILAEYPEGRLLHDRLQAEALALRDEVHARLAEQEPALA